MNIDNLFSGTGTNKKGGLFSNGGLLLAIGALAALAFAFKGKNNKKQQRGAFPAKYNNFNDYRRSMYQEEPGLRRRRKHKHHHHDYEYYEQPARGRFFQPPPWFESNYNGYGRPQYNNYEGRRPEFYGYSRPGFGYQGGESPGYNNPGFGNPGYSNAGFGNPGYNNAGFGGNGYGTPGFSETGPGNSWSGNLGNNDQRYDNPGFNNQEGAEQGYGDAQTYNSEYNSPNQSG